MTQADFCPGRDTKVSDRGPRGVKLEGNLFHPRVPAGAIYVGRAGPGLPASKFANPFRLRQPIGRSHHLRPYLDAAVASVTTVPAAALADATYDTICPVIPAVAVAAYRLRLAGLPDLLEAARAELAGRDLACWCPLGGPCHRDVLLEVSNPACDLPAMAERWRAGSRLGAGVGKGPGPANNDGVDGDEEHEVALRLADGSYSVRKVGPKIRHHYPDDQWVRDQLSLGVPVWERKIIVTEEWHRVAVPPDIAAHLEAERATRGQPGEGGRPARGVPRPDVPALPGRPGGSEAAVRPEDPVNADLAAEQANRVAAPALPVNRPRV